MRPLTRLAFTALCLAAVSGPAAAASLVVAIDQSTRLNVAGAAASVLVGNPAVADVTVVDSHTLYILGRGYGATDIVVLDRDGRPLYTGDLVVGSADSGRVSIYRGAARTDLACAPNCQVSIRSAGAASGGSGGAPGAGASAGGASSGGGTLSQALAAVSGGTP